jgi:hypothetical protein
MMASHDATVTALTADDTTAQKMRTGIARKMRRSAFQRDTRSGYTASKITG